MNVFAEAAIEVIRKYLETPDGKALVHAARTGAPIPPPCVDQDEGGD